MLANQVLDFYDDEPKLILKKVAHKIPQKILSSEFSKIASASTSFALRIMTKKGSALDKYPTTTPADTAISNLYFEETHKKLPTHAREVAATFLKTASDRHGLEVPEIVEKYAKENLSSNMYQESIHGFKDSFEKRASVSIEKKSAKKDIAYALPSMKKFAMPNSDYVKKAEAYFDENYGRMSPEVRKEFAENVAKRGSQCDGFEIQSDNIMKFASNAYVKNPLNSLKQRQMFVKKAAHKNVLKKMAAFVEKTEPREFVEAIFTFDKKAGLQKHYGQHLNDPFLELMAGKPLSKEASYKFKESYSGQYLTGKDLQKTFVKKASKIKEYFGESLADGLKKNGIEAFEALPKDTKNIIGQIAVGAI